jgi:hypothetical protein
MGTLGNNRPPFLFEQNDTPALPGANPALPFAAARPTSVQTCLFRQILHGNPGLATHFAPRREEKKSGRAPGLPRLQAMLNCQLVRRESTLRVHALQWPAAEGAGV